MIRWPFFFYDCRALGVRVRFIFVHLVVPRLLQVQGQFRTSFFGRVAKATRALECLNAAFVFQRARSDDVPRYIGILLLLWHFLCRVFVANVAHGDVDGRPDNEPT